MTMTVYEVTVEFRRRVTPKEYEHAEAFGRLSAQIDGEDVSGALDTLLSTAKSAVLTHLGRGGQDTAKTETKPAASKPEPELEPEPARLDDPEAKCQADAEPDPTDDEGGDDILDDLTAEPEEEGVDDKTLMERSQAAVKKVGPKPVKDLLAKYDVGKLSELSASERVRFVKDLDKMLNGKPS